MTPRTYHLNPPDRTGVLFGLSAFQTGAAGVGVVSFALVTAVAGPVFGLLVAFPFAAAAVRVRGMTVVDAVPLVWSRLRTRGGADWFARLPLVADVLQLPPALDGQDVLAVDGADHGFFGRADAVAVVHDRRQRRLAVTVRVGGRRFALLERAEQDGLLGMWADALAPFARPGSPVVAVRWSEWVAPAGTEEQRRWLSETRPANADADAVAAYERLLAAGGPTTARHDVLVTVAVPDRLADPVRRDRRQAAVAALLTEVRLFVQRLEAAGLTVGDPLSPSELADALRRRLDSGAQPALDRCARTLGARAGVAPLNGGPLAARESWRKWQVDGTLHRAFYVAEWPRLGVPADWLQPLLLHSGAVRTVAVFYEPVAPAESRRTIERQVTKLVTDAEQRARSGFRVDARHTRAEQAVLDREQELVAGYTEFAYCGVVGVCAATATELERAASEVQQVAASIGIELRPLHGRHPSAVAACLPLARMVAGRGMLP